MESRQVNKNEMHNSIHFNRFSQILNVNVIQGQSTVFIHINALLRSDQTVWSDLISIFGHLVAQKWRYISGAYSNSWKPGEVFFQQPRGFIGVVICKICKHEHLVAHQDL